MNPPALYERIHALIDAFPRQFILGVGDVMLDQYRRGRAAGLSPEAPIVKLLNPDLTETPGGAANVSWNVGHLGAHVHLVGVVGNDPAAATLKALVEQTHGVSFTGLSDSTRPTTVKSRFYAGQFQLLRVDHESHAHISHEIAMQCREELLLHASHANALFVEDYGKGMIGNELFDTLQEIRRAFPALPILFDPKVGNHQVYRPGVWTLLKPNWREACELMSADPEEASREAVIRGLGTKYESDVYITLGPNGALVFDRAKNAVVHVPTRRREEYDVAGAGDTTLAVIALSLAAGASLVEAAIIANLAGGIVVAKSGTAYATYEELITELAHPDIQRLLLQKLEPLVIEHKKRGYVPAFISEIASKKKP